MSVATPQQTRLAAIGDAAIGLLAEHGMRGLTHRAVDAGAGLPAGSTSYYARTRAALLELVMARMVELDQAELMRPARRRKIPDPRDLEALSADVADQLHTAVTKGRVRMLARYEFALETTRRPVLRSIYDQAGAQLRGPAAAKLAAAGSTDPERHAHSLIAWCEGMLFDSIAGAGRERPPSLAELRASVRELLQGMLGR
jgi:DNA-binding transcriptional regulator YbjK